MKYSICKDSKVEDTCKTIKNICKDLGINIEEQIHNYPIIDRKMPYSLTLHLLGKIKVSNGKGTSFKNARASAYSEFIERLQNNYIPGFNYTFKDYIYAPDEKSYDESNYDILKDYYNEDSLKILNDRLYSKIKFFTVPFYSLREKTLKDIPLSIVTTLQSTNGMCAGNTPEEAIVQGLSEVYERYAKKKIILENISMPDIPEEVWGKYKRIKELKQYIELYGYEIQIKDASLGENLPVVCTIYRHKEDGFYGFNFGAQPSLPIAIERTFTEIMQSRMPTLEFDIITSDNKKSLNRDYVYEFSTCLNCAVIKNEEDEELYNQFFNNKPLYKFTKTPWVKENQKYTNKELLEFLINNVNIIKDRDIYIRDVSFLNFPSYYIYIPQISEVSKFDINKAYKRDDFFRWQYYTEDKFDANKDINSLISALEYKINYPEFYTRKSFVSTILNEYLLILCYICKKDTDNILKYGKIVLNNPEAKIYRKRTQFIYDYFKNKDTLTGIYKPNYIKNMESFIDNLTFEQIKKRISLSNKQYVENILKKSHKKDVFAYEAKKTYKNYDEKIEQIKQNIADKYIKNIPNQMNLSKVFDFI